MVYPTKQSPISDNARAGQDILVPRMQHNAGDFAFRLCALEPMLYFAYLYAAFRKKQAQLLENIAE